MGPTMSTSSEITSKLSGPVLAWILVAPPTVFGAQQLTRSEVWATRIVGMTWLLVGAIAIAWIARHLFGSQWSLPAAGVMVGSSLLVVAAGFDEPQGPALAGVGILLILAAGIRALVVHRTASSPQSA